MHRIKQWKIQSKILELGNIILSIDKTTTEGYVCMRVYLTTDTGLSTTTFSVILFENNWSSITNLYLVWLDPFPLSLFNEAGLHEVNKVALLDLILEQMKEEFLMAPVSLTAGVRESEPVVSHRAAKLLYHGDSLGEYFDSKRVHKGRASPLSPFLMEAQPNILLNKVKKKWQKRGEKEWKKSHDLDNAESIRRCQNQYSY